jgi:hypothetical protein
MFFFDRPRWKGQRHAGMAATQIIVKKEPLEVVSKRTWREYIEESVLIVFSVVLALFLTELFQKFYENNQLRAVVHELREELIANKKAEEIQLHYHLQVLKNIDSALAGVRELSTTSDFSRILPQCGQNTPVQPDVQNRILTLAS